MKQTIEPREPLVTERRADAPHGEECSCWRCVRNVNVPYDTLCLHPEKCAGRTSCPRSYACSE